MVWVNLVYFCYIKLYKIVKTCFSIDSIVIYHNSDIFIDAKNCIC